jgi:hypothetical protein
MPVHLSPVIARPDRPPGRFWSNARSNERMNDFYTEPPTEGRLIGVFIERLFEL